MRPSRKTQRRGSGNSSADTVEGSDGSWDRWMCGIPVVLAAGVYFNSLDGQFVHDDLSAITGNHDVTGSGSTGSGSGRAGSGTTAWDFLRNDFWGTALLDPKSHKSYRPLTILTFK